MPSAWKLILVFGLQLGMSQDPARRPETLARLKQKLICDVVEYLMRGMSVYHPPAWFILTRDILWSTLTSLSTGPHAIQCSLPVSQAWSSTCPHAKQCSLSPFHDPNPPQVCTCIHDYKRLSGKLDWCDVECVWSHMWHSAATIVPAELKSSFTSRFLPIVQVKQRGRCPSKSFYQPGIPLVVQWPPLNSNRFSPADCFELCCFLTVQRYLKWGDGECFKSFVWNLFELREGPL